MSQKVSKQALSFVQDNEHHMEFVAEKNGITFINDSRSTDVQQTVQSIDGLDAEIVLIIGGRDERTDYSWFLNIRLEKIKSVIYLGREPGKLFRVFGKYDCFFATAMHLEEALQITNLIAKQGQAVLFSPGCPSYDAFDNYKNRGNSFKQLVLKPAKDNS